MVSFLVWLFSASAPLCVFLREQTVLLLVLGFLALLVCGAAFILRAPTGRRPGPRHMPAARPWRRRSGMRLFRRRGALALLAPLPLVTAQQPMLPLLVALACLLAVLLLGATVVALLPARRAAWPQLVGGLAISVTLAVLLALTTGEARATGPLTLTDTTTADFAAGTRDTNTYIGQMSAGEVLLAPTVGAEFSGTTVPTGWTATPWATGGGVTVAGGAATIDAALLATAAYYPAGRSVEFVATFDPTTPLQHVGLGLDLNSTPWAIFSTGSSGGALYARTNSSAGWTDTLISGNWLGAPHRFRIEWGPLARSRI